MRLRTALLTRCDSRVGRPEGAGGEHVWCSIDWCRYSRFTAAHAL